MPMRRIPPQTVDGQTVEPLPPCGGSWIRDAAGGLTPADEATARSAGLWDEPEPASEPAAPVNPKKQATKE